MITPPEQSIELLISLLRNTDRQLDNHIARRNQPAIHHLFRTLGVGNAEDRETLIRALFRRKTEMP